MTYLPPEEWVYFALAGPYIKVGYSLDPERRVARLWRGSTRYARPADCPLDPPVLLAKVMGDKVLERLCHRALSDWRATREFFLDEPPVREFIDACVRGESPARLTRQAGPLWRDEAMRLRILGMTAEEEDARLAELARLVYAPTP